MKVYTFQGMKVFKINDIVYKIILNVTTPDFHIDEQRKLEESAVEIFSNVYILLLVILFQEKWKTIGDCFLVCLTHECLLAAFTHVLEPAPVCHQGGTLEQRNHFRSCLYI